MRTILGLLCVTALVGLVLADTLPKKKRLYKRKVWQPTPKKEKESVRLWPFANGLKLDYPFSQN